MQLRMHILALCVCFACNQSHTHTLQSYAHYISNNYHNAAALALGAAYGTYKIATAPDYNHPCNIRNVCGLTAGVLAQYVTGGQYAEATSNLISTIIGIGTTAFLDFVCSKNHNVSVTYSQKCNKTKLDYKVGTRNWVTIIGNNPSNLQHLAETVLAQSNEHPNVKKSITNMLNQSVNMPSAQEKWNAGFKVTSYRGISDLWRYITG